MYGQINGKSSLDENYVDELGMDYEDIDKPTVLMEVSKVKNNN